MTQIDNSGIMKYEFNIDGTVKKVTMPDGKSMTYGAYNRNKQLKTSIDHFGNTTEYQYTGGGYVSKITSANKTTEYDYYSDGMLKWINVNKVDKEEESYTYKNCLLLVG